MFYSDPTAFGFQMVGLVILTASVALIVFGGPAASRQREIRPALRRLGMGLVGIFTGYAVSFIGACVAGSWGPALVVFVPALIAGSVAAWLLRRTIRGLDAKRHDAPPRADSTRSNS
ncbi:hypothetical protein RI685_16185 (plasmid) [Clavibacter michiganensis]|uniref:hypothetical protein n=1 Tax=Clavibacter michiganensis TaxID=28447 RepID=UPI003DA14C2F